MNFIDMCIEYQEEFLLNKSQYEVAKEIGCTPQNVQAFEKGKTKSGKILEYYVKAGYKYE